MPLALLDHLVDLALLLVLAQHLLRQLGDVGQLGERHRLRAAAKDHCAKGQRSKHKYPSGRDHDPVTLGYRSETTTLAAASVRQLWIATSRFSFLLASSFPFFPPGACK